MGTIGISEEEANTGSGITNLASKTFSNSQKFLFANYFYYSNIIIFDWDDTLLCTSHLSENNLLFCDCTKFPEKDLKEVKQLEKAVFAILSLSIQNGCTYIVTNAAPGWVEYSISKLYPSVTNLLKNIKIISARGLYEKEFPTNPRQWKINTFTEIIFKSYELNMNANIICVGDSEHELEAGGFLSKKFSKNYLKTIKFKESPRIKDLIVQNNLIINNFDNIVSAWKNLTIKVEKKSNIVP
jgi:hypothetical protein